MMHEEFEKLAGYEVSYNDYHDIIEPMYMATNLSKEEFVKCIDKKHFALKTEKQIIAKMRKLAKQLMETCDHYTDFETQREVQDLMDELNARFYGGNGFVRYTTTLENGRGCSFPHKIEIYGGNDIILAKPWYMR